MGPGGRLLSLPTTRDRFAVIASSARLEQQEYLGFLAELVVAECEGRDRRRAEQRILDAGFPWPKRLEDFSFDANPAVNASLLGRLAECDWVRIGSPLCLVGGAGTGKSHLLIGLGTCAAEAGYRVRYTPANRLIAELAAAGDDECRADVIGHYGDVDLLLIDDLDHRTLDRRGAELLLAVLTHREQRCAIGVATSGPFLRVGKPFTGPDLCGAILERLTLDGQIIETGSYGQPRGRT